MDASVYAPVTDILLRLEWDVETAEQAKLTGKIDDTKWIIHARKEKRIAVTFDELKGEQGTKVSRELRKRGGAIIRINGAWNEFRAIGKLLYHYPDWYPFLETNDGISVISSMESGGFKNYSPEEYHLHYHKIDAELFTQYLNKRKSRTYHTRKRKTRVIPDDQPPFI